MIHGRRGRSAPSRWAWGGGWSLVLLRATFKGLWAGLWGGNLPRVTPGISGVLWGIVGNPEGRGGAERWPWGIVRGFA